MNAEKMRRQAENGITDRIGAVLAPENAAKRDYSF